MVEEGFDVCDLLQAITGFTRIVEKYAEARRVLVLGRFHAGWKVSVPLHLVLDLGQPDWVDIVTAYIPQPPAWTTPTRRGVRRWSD